MKSTPGIPGVSYIDSCQAAEEIFAAQQQKIFRSTDRLFAGLMAFQWVFAVALSLLLTPRTWIGGQSAVHPHVWTALVLGALISAAPIALALQAPGWVVTRHIIAISQMLMSALLIHITGGRVETHFHIFGSLAFLAFYRDWKVLVPATLVVLLDHYTRGVYMPTSVFGYADSSIWRVLEHAGWVVFEDVFLIVLCERSTREMRTIAESTADLERANIALRDEIREREAAEKAAHELALRNQQLAVAIDNAPVGVLISDPTQPDDPAIFVNPAFTKITGYTAEEVIGKNCRFLQGQGTDPAIVSEIRQKVDNREPYEGTLLNFRKDGTPFWNDLRISPVFNDQGELINFIGLQSDVTDRVEAEAKLAQSEEQYRNVINSVNEVLFQTDAEGNWSFLNHAWTQMTGHDLDESLGQACNAKVLTEDSELYRQMFQPVLDGNKEYCRFEVRFRGKDNRLIWVELFARPILNEDGAVTGTTGTLMDITERKLAEEAIMAARVEAEEANRAKSEFLSRMSHELRTPLNAILGFGQLLERKGLPDLQSDWVRHIVTAGQHLLGLINEVLDLSRIESGRLQLSLEPVCVGDVVQEVMDLARPLAAQQNIILPERDPSLDAQFVIADRQRVKQVLLNLVANAIKYNVPGGVVALEGKVINAESKGGAKYRLAVKDTGRGISREMMRRLFTPFDRLGAEQTEIQGTGLGLAVSKRLLEAMHGTIGLESQEGLGSVFWLELPVGENPLAVVEARPASNVPADEHTFAQQKTLLYIEDNLSNLKLIEHLLAGREDIKLITAVRGQLGLELARDHHPDLILLDLHLPDIMGWDILGKLNEVAETRDIPVVVVSADATPSQVTRLLSAGADHYLTKPIDVNQFLHVVEEVLK